MRVLWVSMNASLYDAKKGDSYGGTGWIGALYNQLMNNSSERIELGVIFAYNSTIKETIEGVTYYGIKSKKPKGFRKWLYYLRDYKSLSHLDYYDEISSAIEDFKPDIIHLWGVENRLASVSHYKDVPVVAHLQGLLSLYKDTYYPYATNKYSIYLDNPSIRECVLHNGLVFEEKEMLVRAEIEKKHLQAIPAVMGRTDWDRKVALFNNPHVRYYHVDEALRTQFYSSVKWSKPLGTKVVLYSTISDTIYKGLDVVLKAASILKQYNYFEFEWRIAGIIPNSAFVRLFEKQTGIKVSDVSIKILGRQTPDQLITGLLESDLYIHPSYIDNSPNSLCEAQYLGVPCCATNVGGVSSLIQNNETGMLIPANAPFDMAMAVKDRIDNDEAWRVYASNGCEEAMYRHNPGRILHQLLTVYKELAK